MAEYIERESLLEDIQAAVENEGMGSMVAGALKRYVKRVTAADVAPVRHGRWIHTDLAAHWLGKDECSECTYHEKDRRDLSHFNYCPNCGAKMDGGDDNSVMA